jgi:hypothetical protein
MRMAALLVVLLVGIGCAAWMNRYDAKTTSTQFVSQITDRWTGQVFYCGLGSCKQVWPNPISN